MSAEAIARTTAGHKKQADIAQWPAAAAHRQALDAVFGQVSKASGQSTPEALIKVIPLQALSDQLVATIKLILAKDYRTVSGGIKPGATDDARLDRFESLARHLLQLYPKDNWIYVVAGNSLVPAGIYLQQLAPDAKVINLPASNVGVIKLTNEKFEHQRFLSFYHLHFGVHLEKLRAGQRLLLVDYSKQGATLNALRVGIRNYLEHVGLVGDPDKFVQTFGFSTFNKGPEAQAGDMDLLLTELANEVMKEFNAILFFKAAWTRFAGYVEDPQQVCLQAYVELWNAICSRLQRRNVQVPKLT